MRELVKVSGPAPSLVLLSVKVGSVLVEFQQTPRNETLAPPSEVISPPQVALSV